MLSVTTVILSATLLAVLGGVVVPLLTTLVLKASVGGVWKAVVNAGLAAVAGALVSITQAGGLITEQTLLNIAVAFGSSVAAYLGLWHPTGVDQHVAVQTATVGFGPKAPAAAAQ